MDHDFMLIPASMLNTQAIADIMKCNDVTERFGLALSVIDTQELVETRTEALASFGRIEFGGGIIDKLIIKFCDSPYITQRNYARTLHDLIETFYYFKNECEDKLSDEELILLMKRYFDKSCQGSMELLQTRELEILSRNIRTGIYDYKSIAEEMEDKDEEDKDEEDEDEYDEES